MKEIDYFLTVLTDNTLIVIDELGRSTSLEAGTAIAIAICTKLLSTKAFTFITTHYTLLPQMQKQYLNVKNWQMETLETDRIIYEKYKAFNFTYTLKPGIVSLKRYGIYFARICWPRKVIEEVERVMDEDEMNNENKEPEFESIHPLIRLKYDCEAELQLLPRKTMETITERLVKYRQDYTKWLKEHDNESNEVENSIGNNETSNEEMQQQILRPTVDLNKTTNNSSTFQDESTRYGLENQQGSIDEMSTRSEFIEDANLSNTLQNNSVSNETSFEVPRPLSNGLVSSKDNEDLESLDKTSKKDKSKRTSTNTSSYLNWGLSEPSSKTSSKPDSPNNIVNRRLKFLKDLANLRKSANEKNLKNIETSHRSETSQVNDMSTSKGTTSSLNWDLNNENSKDQTSNLQSCNYSASKHLKYKDSNISNQNSVVDNELEPIVSTYRKDVNNTQIIEADNTQNPKNDQDNFVSNDNHQECLFQKQMQNVERCSQRNSQDSKSVKELLDEFISNDFLKIIGNKDHSAQKRARNNDDESITHGPRLCSQNINEENQSLILEPFKVPTPIHKVSYISQHNSFDSLEQESIRSSIDAFMQDEFENEENETINIKNTQDIEANNSQVNVQLKNHQDDNLQENLLHNQTQNVEECSQNVQELDEFISNDLLEELRPQKRPRYNDDESISYSPRLNSQNITSGENSTSNLETCENSASKSLKYKSFNILNQNSFDDNELESISSTLKSFRDDEFENGENMAINIISTQGINADSSQNDVESKNLEDNNQKDTLLQNQTQNVDDFSQYIELNNDEAEIVRELDEFISKDLLADLCAPKRARYNDDKSISYGNNQGEVQISGQNVAHEADFPQRFENTIKENTPQYIQNTPELYQNHENSCLDNHESILTDNDLYNNEGYNISQMTNDYVSESQYVTFNFAPNNVQGDGNIDDQNKEPRPSPTLIPKLIEIASNVGHSDLTSTRLQETDNLESHMDQDSINYDTELLTQTTNEQIGKETSDSEYYDFVADLKMSENVRLKSLRNIEEGSYAANAMTNNDDYISKENDVITEPCISETNLQNLTSTSSNYQSVGNSNETFYKTLTHSKSTSLNDASRSSKSLFKSPLNASSSSTFQTPSKINVRPRKRKTGFIAPLKNAQDIVDEAIAGPSTAQVKTNREKVTRKRKASTFNAPLKPPKRLTRKEIEDDFLEQDMTLFEGGGQIDKRRFLNRPSVKQLQDMVYVAHFDDNRRPILYDDAYSESTKRSKNINKSRIFSTPLKYSAEASAMFENFRDSLKGDSIISDKNDGGYLFSLNARPNINLFASGRNNETSVTSVSATDYFDNIVSNAEQNDCNISNSTDKIMQKYL